MLEISVHTYKAIPRSLAANFHVGSRMIGQKPQQSSHSLVSEYMSLVKAQQTHSNLPVLNWIEDQSSINKLGKERDSSLASEKRQNYTKYINRVVVGISEKPTTPVE